MAAGPAGPREVRAGPFEAWLRGTHSGHQIGAEVALQQFDAEGLQDRVSREWATGWLAAMGIAGVSGCPSWVQGVPCGTDLGFHRKDPVGDKHQFGQRDLMGCRTVTPHDRGCLVPAPHDQRRADVLARTGEFRPQAWFAASQWFDVR